MSTPPPLSITILGAGIAGLTATIALRQQGHHVRVLEKAPSAQEVGAAIQLSPNCSGILRRLGMKPFSVGAHLCTGMAQYFGASGKVRMKMDLTEVNKQWSNPWFLIHRVDLHRELMRLALDPEGEGPVPELLLGCVSVDLEADKGVVTLDDGRAFPSDVVLGADGNFSFARKHVDPSTSPYPWGKACYRFLVPRQELLDDEETRPFVDEDGWFAEASEADRRFVWYQCRNRTMINFAVFVPNEEANASGADWNQKGNRATMLKAFENFFPAAQKLLSHSSDDVRVWQLYDMEPLKHWAKDRVALLGDAAHPFAPFLGQGGAMAIEDAASLAQVLKRGTSVDQVPARLQLYERIRHERVTWVQQQTRINGMDEDKRPATKGGFVMLVYCHNHDEWENSAAKLQEWLQEEGLQNGA